MKNKKEKKTRQKAADEDDIFAPLESVQPAQHQAEAMEIEGAQLNGVHNAAKKRTLEFDDEDLQAQLAEQRREARARP